LCERITSVLLSLFSTNINYEADGLGSLFGGVFHTVIYGSTATRRHRLSTVCLKADSDSDKDNIGQQGQQRENDYGSPIRNLPL
jgi:hypothetical protein